MLGVILLVVLAFALALNSTPIPHELLDPPKAKACGLGYKLALLLSAILLMVLFVTLLDNALAG